MDILDKTNAAVVKPLDSVFRKYYGTGWANWLAHLLFDGRHIFYTLSHTSKVLRIGVLFRLEISLVAEDEASEFLVIFLAVVMTGANLKPASIFGFIDGLIGLVIFEHI